MAYATQTDLGQLGATTRALEGISSTDLDAALEAASSEADTYLAVAYTVPLTTYPKALTLHVANMAAWHALRGEGFSPEAGEKDPIRTGYEDAIAWLRRAAKGEIILTPSQTSPTPSARPAVTSDDPRGF